MNINHRERLGQVNAEIAEKTAEAQTRWAAFENARERASKGGSTATAEQVHVEYAKTAAELKELEHIRDGLFRQLAGSKDSPTARGAITFDGKTIGQRATDSFEYKELVRSGALSSERARFEAKIGEISTAELKTLITGVSDTSAGAHITNERVEYVPQPRRPASVLSLITTGQTNSDAVEYARQSTWTNVAAETAEATDTSTGTKPEATIAFTKVTETVKTIAHYVPATRRALSDVGQLQTLIDSQLRYGLELRLEDQVINGNGSGENITGILNTSNILSQAKGSDSVSDAILKAITQLRLGYVEPNGVALHPTDYQLLRLARDDSGATTGTGAYLYGPPSDPGPPSIWGVPLVVTTAVPDDTGLVGDWSKAILWLREAAQVLASDSHSDFFIKNLVAVLAEMRAAFGVLLPAAFAKVTSLD